MKYIYIILFLFCLKYSNGQEINATVSINYSQVQTSNNKVFTTLEKELKNFINNTKWTDKTYKPFERINVSFSIIINEKLENNTYGASMVVQSQRPVYNSNYLTPTLNFNDKNFKFHYIEFEPLIFNERKFSGNNLTDVIAYYVYLILGIDSDTFSKNGGQTYFEKAKKIATNSEGQGFEGWTIFDGPNSRTSLISDILKPQNNALRNVWYQYHRLAFDTLVEDEENSKIQFVTALTQLSEYQNNPLFFPLDLFIEAKKQEIKDIFSAGKPSKANTALIKEILSTISPMNKDEYWSKIK